MARSLKLRVMLSSKCETEFPKGSGKKLSKIRLDLKEAIEKMEIGGRRVFEVWINEIAPPSGGSWDSWEVCLEAVKSSDILIVISNGEAGGAANAGEIGICHAEMMTGLSLAPAKVRLIALPNVPITADADGVRNKRFQDELKKQSLFRGGTVNNEQELKSRVNEALHDAAITLAQFGVRDAARGKYHSGAALDWSRLDFSARREVMIAIVRSALLARAGSTEKAGRTYIRLNDVDVLVEAHAIPAALTIGSAREMVGQPFLRDYELSASLQGEVGGPLHIIACHKTATESQAAKLLGFPDAIIVVAPFGIFVADRVQKVQFAFITNCRDEANTRHGVQRFFEWLRQTNEEATVAEHALGRARIVKVMAEVMVGSASSSATTAMHTSKRKSRSKPIRSTT